MSRKHVFLNSAEQARIAWEWWNDHEKRTVAMFARSVGIHEATLNGFIKRIVKPAVPEDLFVFERYIRMRRLRHIQRGNTPPDYEMTDELLQAAWAWTKKNAENGRKRKATRDKNRTENATEHDIKRIIQLNNNFIKATARRQGND